MKKLLPVFFLWSLCAFAAGPDHSDRESQEIIAPVKAVFEGFFHQDAAMMSAPFSPEATFISTNGQVTQGLKAIEDKHLALFLLTGPLNTQYEWDSFQLNQLSGSIAYVTLHFSATLETGDKPIVQKAYCSAVLEKGKKGWKIRLFQMTAEA